MKTKKIRDTILVFCLLALPAEGRAQQNPAGPNPGSDDPVEITAGQTLEWHRGAKQFIARGQVVAAQGDVSLHCETLSADYRENTQSSMEIWQLTAQENVRIQDKTTTAFGDRAVYDIDKGYAVLTGKNLKLQSPDQTVTAQDRLEYWSAKGEAQAVGHAKVVRGKDTIYADRLRAVFKENAQGKQEVEILEALGNVVIVTPSEKLFGDKGIYRAASNKAELIGNVRIERGPNKLEGSRAEVDLTTEVSKIFGAPESGGRVRGVFYPGSEKKSGPSPLLQVPQNNSGTGYKAQ
ncbi:MAG: ostA-like family protein [Rhodospirillales bacterium]|nr:ostA-like family protein [Alphaproteobacteria bacterium]USO03965.1 MAG: ostA-like family protein [Rhodospirillales bacterium]